MFRVQNNVYKKNSTRLIFCSDAKRSEQISFIIYSLEFKDVYNMLKLKVLANSISNSACGKMN